MQGLLTRGPFHSPTGLYARPILSIKISDTDLISHVVAVKWTECRLAIQHAGRIFGNEAAIQEVLLDGRANQEDRLYPGYLSTVSKERSTLSAPESYTGCGLGNAQDSVRS